MVAFFLANGYCVLLYRRRFWGSRADNHQRGSLMRTDALTRLLVFGFAFLFLASGIANAQTPPSCPGRILQADVVAMDQVLTLNRLNAHMTNGLIYALQSDVVGSAPGQVHLQSWKRPRPIVL